MVNRVEYRPDDPCDLRTELESKHLVNKITFIVLNRMKIKLVQLLLLGSSLLTTILLYNMLSRLSDGTLTLSTLVVVIGAISAYGYAAVTFMTVKGIDLFAKTNKN